MKLELEVEKEGGEAICTPPGLCVFQPIELYGADLKGDIVGNTLRVEIFRRYRAE